MSLVPWLLVPIVAMTMRLPGATRPAAPIANAGTMLGTARGPELSSIEVHVGFGFDFRQHGPQYLTT